MYGHPTLKGTKKEQRKIYPYSNGQHLGKKKGELKLLRHDLGIANRGSSLVCYSLTYLEYKSLYRVIYAIPLSHISDIRELAVFFLLTNNYISKATLNIHGKIDAPSTKVTRSGVK